MSTSLRPSLIPQCTSCARRLTKIGFQDWRPSQQQVRGKKKLANTSSTVTVRLLKDVETFGRKGSYVPISIGQMRNEWFPRRVAEYVTNTQLKDLKTRNIASERDFEFGVKTISKAEPLDIRAQAAAAQARTLKNAVRAVEMERLTPERSAELISILVPSRLDFNRQRVVPTPAPAPAPTPAAKPAAPKARQNSVSSAAADLLAARSMPVKPSSVPTSTASTTAIYGSVSTADVANSIKAVLAENDEAAKIVFADDDVRFVNVSVDGQPAVETDKLKNLGEFEVEVRIKGVDTPVKKTVRVLPQESSV